MDLTTLAKYKLFDTRYNGQQPASTNQDGLLQDAITSISALVTKQLCRVVQIGSFVTPYNTFSHVRSLRVPAFPVSMLTSVTLDGDDITQYAYCDMQFGRVLFSHPVKAKYPMGLVISYTGGMAADTASFALAYPGLVMEIHKQIKFELVRRPTLGQETVGTGQERAVLTPNRLIPSLMDAITPLKPPRVGA